MKYMMPIRIPTLLGVLIADDCDYWKDRPYHVSGDPSGHRYTLNQAKVLYIRHQQVKNPKADLKNDDLVQLLERCIQEKRR